MKKIIIALFACLPLVCMAQTEKVLTPQEKLEQARKAAEAAQKALKEAEKEAKKAQAKTATETPATPQPTTTQPTTTQPAGWTVPEQKTTTVDYNEITKAKKRASKEASEGQKRAEYQKYLTGAVPLTDGAVKYTLDLDVPGQNAQQIYDNIYAFMGNMTQEPNQTKGSSIALVNKEEHVIATHISEWLTFTDNFLSLDRTLFNYMLIATCTDGHLYLTMDRLSYEYETDRPSGFKTSAEEWITDKYALNKKQTKLLPVSGKFRKATIDRKNYIFSKITSALLKK
jgi:hypothetical protein